MTRTGRTSRASRVAPTMSEPVSRYRLLNLPENMTKANRTPLAEFPSLVEAEEFDIEPFEPAMMDAVIGLSLRAWEPVFASMEAGMDSDVFKAFYPDGWRDSQSAVVRDACSSAEIDTRVAVADGEVVGFVATKLHEDGVMGEIYMIAVDPDCQRLGVGIRLTDDAIERLRSDGVSVVMVETGGDPGHAPARRLYERTGFRVFPIARYFRSV